ncbi:MAG: NAD(+)/NADH kinase [Oscillospiraceae bacterium]|nr:NAD(+)/NADH kinase [Oscillospiraceae bacterium]
MKRKIILCPNPLRDLKLEYARKVYKLLAYSGHQLEICPVTDDYDVSDLPGGVVPKKLKDVCADADMLITFGGDGTIMNVAREAISFNVPILAINLGTKGFMAEVEPDEFDLIAKAANGDYTLDHRMMLSVKVERKGEIVFTDFALNEATIGGSMARMITVTIFGDGKKISGFAGDGVVIATPTGSTAYSMSAGGPIVEPMAENILVTPICAHDLLAKSFVLRPERKVTVLIGPLDKRYAYLSEDGWPPFDLEAGDKVLIERSIYDTTLVRVSNKSFYEKVSEKLGEGR